MSDVSGGDTEPTPAQDEAARKESAEQDDTGLVSSAAPPRTRWLLYALTLLVLVADQGTKMLALARLEPGEYRPLLGEFFGWQLVFNPGAAFSFLSGATWIFTIAAAIVTVLILIVSVKVQSRAWALGLGLLLGGNLGNLADRLFRDPGFGIGHVVDFLNYAGFFIGNVADIAIVVAAALLGWLLIRGVGLDGRRHVRVEPEPEPEPQTVSGDGEPLDAERADEEGDSRPHYDHE